MSRDCNYSCLKTSLEIDSPCPTYFSDIFSLYLRKWLSKKWIDLPWSLDPVSLHSVISESWCDYLLIFIQYLLSIEIFGYSLCLFLCTYLLFSSSRKQLDVRTWDTRVVNSSPDNTPNDHKYLFCLIVINHFCIHPNMNICSATEIYRSQYRLLPMRLIRHPDLYYRLVRFRRFSYQIHQDTNTWERDWCP